MKVQCDTNNGIFLVNRLDDYNAPEVVSGDRFVMFFEILEDGEEWAADLNFRQALAILRKGYAIRRYP